MQFRVRLTDVRFGDLLVDQSGHLVTAAQHLAEVMAGDQASRLHAAQRLQSTDQSAEAAAHAMLRALSAAFVTPFDRVDVYRVSWSMRRCVSRMDAVADEIVLFQLADLPDGVTELVKLVVHAADIARQVVPLLARPRRLAEPWIELTRLGKQAGREQRRLLAHITATTVDLAVLARLVAVAHSLGRLVDAFDELADVLQTVAVKEA